MGRLFSLLFPAIILASTLAFGEQGLLPDRTPPSSAFNLQAIEKTADLEGLLLDVQSELEDAGFVTKCNGEKLFFRITGSPSEAYRFFRLILDRNYDTLTEWPKSSDKYAIIIDTNPESETAIGIVVLQAYWQPEKLDAAIYDCQIVPRT
jgi:hypothetical protein